MKLLTEKQEKKNFQDRQTHPYIYIRMYSCMDLEKKKE